MGLLILAALSLASPGRSVCKSRLVQFSDQHPLAQSKINHEAERTSATGTFFHIYLTDLQAAPIDQLVDDEIQFPSSIPLSNLVGKVIGLGDDLIPFRVVKMTSDRNLLLLAEPAGRRITFRQRERANSGNFRFMRIADTFLEDFETDLVRDLKRPSANRSLARSLAEAQLKDCVAARSLPSFLRQQRLAALAAANKKMLLSLENQDPLTANDLEVWNRTLLAKENPLAALSGGIIRGTRKSFMEKDGAELDIDLTGEVATTFLEYMPGKFMATCPAAEVPERLAALLTRANAIERGASLKTVVQIYREFETIGPMLLGNLRTGRILLDYCLFKAGYPSSSERFSHAKVLIFISDDEATANLRTWIVGR